MSTPERFLAVVSIVSAVSYAVIGGKSPATGPGNAIIVVTPIVVDAYDPVGVSDAISVSPCTFDRAGKFSLSEMLPLDDDGARAPGRRCIDAGLFTAPGPFAIDASGRLYVSIDALSFRPNAGAVPRFE